LPGVPDASTFGVFAVAALALIVVPGPSVLYVVTRGLEQGRTAGVVGALGNGLGAIAHVLAAALGLSALLVSSATAFTIVKYAGAAYLVLLGLRELCRRRPGDEGVVEVRPASLARVFWQGTLVSALNPKTALFFLAFLPQFTDPARGAIVGQIVALGLVFCAIAVISDSTWGLAAGTVGPRLRAGVRRGLQRWGSGTAFVALGVGAALTTARRAT
jgi:threonine/homoserine/homoserine lactone efflux protein